jgi:hypothetical protein
VIEFVRVKLQEEYSAERESNEIFSTEEFPEFSDWLIQKGIHPENIHGITDEGKNMVKKFINEWVVESIYVYANHLLNKTK